MANAAAAGTDHPTSPLSSSHAIPLDDFERVRVQKLAALRARMTAETLGVDRTDDVEAATVRAMIQKAVGLAFVRASKVVLGVSMHGGSGIVLARLSDGTWSAPSAIGMWGLGFGIQFGLEVAEYIFILQTPEAMQHFRRGGSYTVGGNMGVAVGGLGREAYGAASVGGGNLCGNDTTTPSREGGGEDDEYNDQNEYDSQDGGVKASREAESSLGVAPIVAYAKSQGLYVGVSLEGSRIFTRNDINCRTYKFATGRNVTAHDILSGKVPTPPEAEELYAALHSVEFTHEMSCLPRPPEVLRKVSANAWTFDRTIQLNPGDSFSPPHHPFDFFGKLSQREAEECDAFEAQFKNFMYGGVSVQRLLTDNEGHTDRTGKERRTLWLMLPEIGSLRLGFVSKLSDGEGAVSNKSSTLRARRDDPSRMSVAGVEAEIGTVGSEDLTLDSALYTRVRLLDRLRACGIVFLLNTILSIWQPRMVPLRPCEEGMFNYRTSTLLP
jgi:lipid-binding SYLF domain-containing protein